jgi:YidC/Oxa1 family membrane protein insertase
MESQEMGHIFYLVVIYPLIQIIEFTFTFCVKLFNKPGIAVICVSFTVSMLTLPLYVVAEYWQNKERCIQKKMKPGMDRIKSAFKGNEQYMMLATYYRQNHYHPIMSMRASFGLLIQIPFFAAAYIYLSHLGALDNAKFFFIRNMGAQDALFMVGSFPVNVLPVTMTLINIIAGAIYTRGLPLRDKLQIYGMALLFLVILYGSPAGLVLYWTMNNIFSLVKNIFYRLKNPLKLLYIIMCTAALLLSIWLIVLHPIAREPAITICAVISVIYFIPLLVRFFTWLADNFLAELADTPKRRLAMFFASACGLCLLSGLLLQTLLVASSPMEFSGIDTYGNPMFFIGNAFLQCAGFCIVWPGLIYFMYHRRGQTLIAAVFAVLLPCAIVNAILFPGNYGTLSRLLVFTQASDLYPSAFQTVLNLLILAAVAAAVILILHSGKVKQFSTAELLIMAALGGVSAVNIHTINNGYAEYIKVSAAGTEKKQLSPIFHFSKTGKNVLMIYLDRAENRFVQTIFDESPELYVQYSGFTLFTNTVSTNGHTLMGAPACYGGYEYTPELMNKRSTELLSDKQNEALLLLPRIFTEQIKDYSATVTDPSWANYSWVPDLSIYKKYPGVSAYLTDQVYLDLWYKEHKDTAKINVTSMVLKRNMVWYALLRTTPPLLRTAVYNQGKYWSSDQGVDDYDSFLKAYSVLDYLPRLTDFNATKPNTFTCFVNNTTHDSLWLQAPDYVPVAHVTDRGKTKYANVSSYATNAASLKRVGTWLQMLRNNGVYDNTRIVIVADHSCTSSEREGYEWSQKFTRIGPGHYHPLLMYKDFGSSGNLVINHDFMSNADVPSLLTGGVIRNPVNPFTKEPLNSADKKRGVLVCTDNIFMPYHSKSKYVFTARPDSWWRVKDSIFKPENWTQEIHEWK